MNFNSISANWQTYLFYVIIVALTGVATYLKLIDSSLFTAAIIGVIGNGLGQAQAKASVSAQIASGSATSQTPAPQNGVISSQESASTPKRG